MIATTNYGRVRGASAPGGGYVFRGVPYASPPVGAQRWRPAKPPETWSGVLDTASSFMPQCPQPPAGGLAARILPNEISSEDCLYCNIWTPGIDDKKRPVAVWVHGGGFMMGSGAWPDGGAFARDGIVLVSFNYRLGPFGFLHLDELFDGFAGTGNLGLSDQIAVLRWIQENIKAFGGDPDNVTIFGESAGAISVGTLLGSPEATGLFRRAITQSGAAHHARSAVGATLVARHFCEILGVSPGDNDALLRTTAEQLIDATMQLLARSQQVADLLVNEDPLGSSMIFSPVIDGRLLEKRPIEAIRDGSAAGVDLLTGVNEDEWRLVVFGMGAEAAKSVPPPDLDRLKAGTGVSGDELLAGYEKLLPDKNRPDVYCDIQSDLVFMVPARRLADAQAAHARVYCYLFGWPAPIMDGILGVCHALEIPFVFDQLQETSALVGNAPPQSLADMMHRAWIAFMSDGLPAAAGLPEWPSYDATRRATMRLDESPELVFDPDHQRVALWPHW